MWFAKFRRQRNRVVAKVRHDPGWKGLDWGDAHTGGGEQLRAWSTLTRK